MITNLFLKIVNCTLHCILLLNFAISHTYSWAFHLGIKFQLSNKMLFLCKILMFIKLLN